MTKTSTVRSTLPILLVDNNLNDLKPLAKSLEAEGLAVICCQTGHAALQVCQAHEIKVIILDLGLPDMAGVDLGRRLKAYNSQIKIIVWTKGPVDEAVSAVADEIAFAYVDKTGDIEQVLGQVYRAFYIYFAGYSQMLEKEIETQTEAFVKADETLQHEIAERKRTEQTLWNMSQRFRVMIENSNDVVIILDRQATFRYVSSALSRILGYDSADTIGRHISDLVHPNDKTSIMKTIEEAAQHPDMGLVNLECQVLHQDGSWRTLALTLTNLLNIPVVNGFLVNGYDITERKRLEEQLQHSQKMEAVGRLAGGVAHDFNNLLTVITGYSEILLSRHLKETDPLSPLVTEIKKAGERATALTSQLLTFSRRNLHQRKVFDLNPVILNIEKMLRRLIGEDVTLVTKLEPNLGLIKADPSQIEQVIINLAVNARDAMPRGGVLTIKTQAVQVDEIFARHRIGLEAGPYALLSVADTGAGINAETMAHIFEPFFTTKNKGEGTGLGLSIVYGIVQQSDGYIGVESQPGQSTTFEIYLPQTSQMDLPPTLDSPNLQQSGSSETILLVEDEEAVRELANRVLHLDGYTVIEASSGLDAIKISEDYPDTIDLLVTDVVMPGGISGRELAENLTQQRSEMKVLYMSGYTNDATIKHGIQQSEAAFLQKPFTLGSLSKKIRQVLDS